MPVCLFVFLYAARSYISKNHTCKLYDIFCIICYLWQWLGPPLTTEQFKYFRFIDDVMFSHKLNGHMDRGVGNFTHDVKRMQGNN